MMKGWIAAEHTLEEENFLKGLGVVITGETPHPENDPPTVDYAVEVPDEALEKLQEHWGRFIWGLEDAALEA